MTPALQINPPFPMAAPPTGYPRQERLIFEQPVQKKPATLSPVYAERIRRQIAQHYENDRKDTENRAYIEELERKMGEKFYSVDEFMARFGEEILKVYNA
jgi:hypothetical protein